MDSALKPKHRTLFVAAAIILSAAAYFWSYGLHPVWWLVWLAPLPLLWIAPRVPAWAAVATTFSAATLGRLDMWSYYHRLRVPLWLIVIAVLVPALTLTAAVWLYRLFFLRGQLARAVLVFPSVLVAYEYLFSLWQGTFGNTAYTQLRNLPVVQLGALTGLWGIGFVVMLLPAVAVTAFLTRGKERMRIAIAGIAIAAAVLIYGAWRLYSTPAASSTVLVGLAESHIPEHMFPDTDQPTMALMRGYAQQVQTLAAKGAKFIVLPEMTAVVPDALVPQIDALFQQTAHTAGVQVLLGILHVTPHAAYNEGRLYSASGTIETVYRKHHLVPVAEGRTTPGTDISVLSQPIGTIGVEICRDMDYPELARRYARDNVGLVLVPAWEFGTDELWHGHMSLMRGIEDGFSMVRSAKAGFLTISDDRGRVLAEKLTTSNRPFTTMLAEVPIRHDPTLYQKWGDWFAWLNLAVLAAILLSLVQKGAMTHHSRVGDPSEIETDQIGSQLAAAGQQPNLAATPRL